jgi:hypothetical protein
MLLLLFTPYALCIQSYVDERAGVNARGKS